MYQLTFSQQSTSVLNKLAQSMQMQLIDFLSGLNFEQESLLEFGKIIRNKTTYYRIRWKEFRIYFECTGDNALAIHYLLPKHTWDDFLFRVKLPLKEAAVEEKLLENLEE
ncbi:MAG: cytotoxic translational repressor of toxin-antitoxin stability system [Puniceicoccales bacterium]|jgi:mRNA-degrading endonuclease RelE of RelBE toxin-antitoxin system|nr:cytotoxic translational repressor of toxin-antitoxin stability system [Puniceicoccales bacterium]